MFPIKRITIYNIRYMSGIPEVKVKSFKNMPGPPRIPFLGSINDAIIFGFPTQLHQTISKHHLKYGPIFKVKIANNDAVFIKDPEMMRMVFSYEGKYPRHPLPDAWAYFNEKHNCERGLFFMDDEEWLHYRKILNQYLMRDVRWMIGPIQRVCDRTIQSLELKKVNETGKCFSIQNIESMLYKWSIEVILSLMLGSSYTPENALKLEELVEQFSCTVYKIFLYSSKLMAIPPQLADQLQLQTWKQFEKIVPETISIANNIIDISLEEIDRGDGLLSKLQDCIASRNIIKRIFADFIIAAGDTTSFGTLWCLYLLAKNRAVQTLVREDIKNDYLESTLVRGTIRESLRMFPIAPFIGRFLNTDAIIGEYCIPKNTLALLSLYTAGRDERNFCFPNEFLPQRWLRQDDNSFPFTPFSANASLPFAIGKRSCIGRKIALLQMQYFLAKVLSQYQLILLNENEVQAELKLITVPNTTIKLAFEKLN